MQEIEKTFLVKKLPANLRAYKSYKIKQGYISPSPSPLRLRQKGDKYELTKKIPLREGDFSSVEEITILLTEYEFNKLWPLTEKSLEKIRYIIPLDDGLMAEVDVFQKDLEGLVFVEVEFTTEEQMNSFIAPQWFGKDVTQEDFSANVFLAGKNFAGIRQFL